MGGKESSRPTSISAESSSSSSVDSSGSSVVGGVGVAAAGCGVPTGGRGDGSSVGDGRTLHVLPGEASLLMVRRAEGRGLTGGCATTGDARAATRPRVFSEIRWAVWEAGSNTSARVPNMRKSAKSAGVGANPPKIAPGMRGIIPRTWMPTFGHIRSGVQRTFNPVEYRRPGICQHHQDPLVGRRHYIISGHRWLGQAGQEVTIGSSAAAAVKRLN